MHSTASRRRRSWPPVGKRLGGGSARDNRGLDLFVPGRLDDHDGGILLSSSATEAPPNRGRSKMRDGDDAAYITELRGRVGRLEAATKQAAAAQMAPSSSAAAASHASAGGGLEDRLVVLMVGREAAALCLTTAAVRHAPTQYDRKLVDHGARIYQGREERCRSI